MTHSGPLKVKGPKLKRVCLANQEHHFFIWKMKIQPFSLLSIKMYQLYISILKFFSVET